ncbi:hypothetical protein BESB_030340 [Besnoitia besnoiti]|uniref:Transcription factor CBF/NF-Y/archaeal histone domain-containing protein n=1 Tax=Besnoitia besnoiti TaxID=94643 RepID=A0A2A9M6X4_BESBE|nr:hypothetical protein BESB_030340 [Besnoitia besnoiti]PFH31160.1 hypothetical protein BESB_030340 [Besnoitia besnoiti]
MEVDVRSEAGGELGRNPGEDSKSPSAGSSARVRQAASAGSRLTSSGRKALQLPRAHVVRIIKSALPANVRLHRGAVAALMRSSAIFLLALADASAAATGSSRKTVGIQEVLAGLRSIGCDDIAEDIEQRIRSEADMHSRGISSPSVDATSFSLRTHDEHPPRHTTASAWAANEDVDGAALSEPETDSSCAGRQSDIAEEAPSEGELPDNGGGDDEDQEGDALDAMLQVVDGVLAEREPESETQADFP